MCLLDFPNERFQKRRTKPQVVSINKQVNVDLEAIMTFVQPITIEHSIPIDSHSQTASIVAVMLIEWGVERKCAICLKGNRYSRLWGGYSPRIIEILDYVHFTYRFNPIELEGRCVNTSHFFRLRVDCLSVVGSLFQSELELRLTVLLLKWTVTCTRINTLKWLVIRHYQKPSKNCHQIL